MSGKPASVAAPRPGVAGTPRVLVYVAEARQLEAAAAGPDPPPQPQPPLDALYLHDNLPPHLALPRTSAYRPQTDTSDHRSTPGALVYKPFSETDNRLSGFGPPDIITQSNDLFSVTQPFLKEPCSLVRSEENNDRLSNVTLKRDSGIRSDWESGETYHVHIPESRDLDTYQTRCPLNSDSMPSMLPVVAHHSNQFSDSVVQSDGEGIGCDRELSVHKSYVNYQLLEQSVSHQSIVNQSINILNQQVGVNRSLVSEAEGAGPPQLVRTADGVVLAVLPSPVSQTTEVSDPRTQIDHQQTITVPLGWRRIVNGASVLYVSPSGSALSNLPQLRDYLQTAGTCKCGLPCPLRPETAFSFDPKVVSKQYQAASGAELTKLCNHKRKLLATLQSRAQSPATPPPPTLEQKKVAVGETVKKKMKKRPGYSSNMSVSQIMVQRERPLNEFKNHDNEQKRTASPGAMHHRTGNLPQCLPYAQQNIVNVQEDVKPESIVQRGSHYLTVSSGWITQHPETADSGQKANQSSPSLGNSVNVGLPVLGTNGQIIGVNTGYNKHSMNAKNVIGITQQNIGDQDLKIDEKDMQLIKQSAKEEEPQIFCGLNQPLTPEVMQKINEQQQIFIQRNQKQIEVMKGKPQLQNQFVSQGQLIIQNGAVVKTNSNKTPPWQVKRNDSSASNSLICPSPKQQKVDGGEYEELNAHILEDKSSSLTSISNNEQILSQGMCSRVPPLPQHYSIMGQQWAGVDLNKKKTKSSSKTTKKKTIAGENKFNNYGNNGIRYLQDSRGKNCDDIVSNNVPSFMDDPNGYLAQQTVLLNNTISRQVGINSGYDTNQSESSSSYSSLSHGDKPKPTPKGGEPLNTYRNTMVSNTSPSPNTTPDSSLASEKCLENTMAQCCKGCNLSYKGNCSDVSENHMRSKYIKQQAIYGIELESGVAGMSSPKGLFEDNPVTSSTFIERSIMINESCGPIQAGIVSTSNVSPGETLQQPEPSPTLSNSSRSTDTPHSSGGNNQTQNTCAFSIPSPAYSNHGSSRDHFNSNPSNLGGHQTYPFNSPGISSSQNICGTQMMHFISNHNVNKNLMDVDNISMVGVKPGLRNQEMFRLEKRRFENTMPGYCPPPHLGGGPAHSLIQACYVQTFVTTMASGFSVTRDTVTSVLAGKANTSTTSINSSQANFIRPPPPPSINLATTYAIPNNQPDPFLNAVNLPTSYPLHIAGTTAQSMISKSPLEMVQNVISSLPSKSETSHTQTTALPHRRACSTTPGQILISSTGQIIVSNNQMPPPPPKITTTLSPVVSSVSSNVATSVAQVVPGGHPSIVNQQTVVVNTLPTPFVIQPPMMAVDGQVVQQNSVLPQLVSGGMVSGQTSSESSRQIEVKNGQSFVHGVAMLSPESLKKRSKKRKSPATNITNVLQIAAPQHTPNNIMIHHSPQHNSNPQFSPRGFQLSPTNNISPTPMLQALTIVPGKSGTPAHIVMNGQGNTNNFGSQQILTNTSPSQPINLLQPVNLINNASSVMSNFPAFQQFILPNLGGMVMTADGTAIIQDNSTGMPMQLQLQTVNGQNVLTPVQNPGVFTTGTNSGVVIRAQNQQGKIIQSQHSPGAQFLSPNSQVMVNSPNFNGQLSPLLANLSPTNVTFNTSPHQVRSGNVQTQEFIQTNQMGQTLMVPLSPKQVSMASASSNRSNSTFVQQNTTIVQQQTTLVSNSHNTQMSNLQGGNSSRLSIDHNVVLTHKPISSQKSRNFVQIPYDNNQIEEPKEEKHHTQFNQAQQNEVDDKVENSEGYAKFMNEFSPLLGQGSFNSHVRHSVSTQTLVNQQRGKSPNSQAVSGSSPPDTTTHSPLGALETAASPRVYGTRCLSTQGNYADTTTKSPEPTDTNSSAMVQCVSSSEQDMAESRERTWTTPRSDLNADTESQNMMSNIQLMRMNRAHIPVESTEMQYSQNTSSSSGNSQHMLPMTSNLYERHSFKRKNEFGDGSSYRTDKIMRTNYNMLHCLPKNPSYDTIGNSQEKQLLRHFSPPGNSSDITTHKVFDRHVGSGDDSKSEDESERSQGVSNEKSIRKFDVGDLVWGPVKGYASWPGKLEGRCEDGKWSVRWFGGDRAPSAVDYARLLTLSEGLEAHHAARTKHRKSRKLNTLLENAIQEAMADLDKKSESPLDKTPNDNAEDFVESVPITDTPRRNKKQDKQRNKLYKKGSAKVDGTRLRNSR